MSLREALLAPIPGASRAGENLRYDPIYDRIKEARREDLDVPQGEWQQALKKADWPLVIKLATDTLAKRTKDLQVAVWLTEAMLRQEGFAGLHHGLDLLNGLLEEFWDELYPELEDGDAELRAVPLEWLGRSLVDAVRAAPLNAAGHSYVDYLQAAKLPTEEEAEGDNSKQELRKQAIADGKLTPDEFEAEFAATPKAWYKELVAEIDLSIDAVETLERAADERFGSDAPNLLKLRDVLKEVRQSAGKLLVRKLEAEPDPPEVQEVILAEVGDTDGAATADQPGLATAAAPTGTAATALAPRSLDEASAQLAAVARLLRSRAPADPAPYLMLRGYRWGELRRVPGEVDPHLLVAAPTELRTRLKELLLAERWQELLEAGEEIMAAPYGRGWLDLQRYAVSACDALGGEYEALGHALRGALRALLRDVPRLASLALLDDSPTANADTLRWLRAEALIGEAADTEADGPPPLRSNGAHARALAFAKQGETQRAVELLVLEAAREQSERGRFLRRTEAAQVLVEAGQEQVALPILQELLEQIDTHQLEQWEEGATVALTLSLAHRSLQTAAPEDSALDSLYLRICRLDPLRAMQLPARSGDG
jgi:type VI secretion system protein ImpA